MTSPLETAHINFAGATATSAMSNLEIGARQKARHHAVQALYQWILTGANSVQIEAEFRTDNDMAAVDSPYFRELVYSVIAQAGDLDAHYARYLDRALRDLDPVSLAQLRLSTYELKTRLDVPWRVVVDEAVRLSKKFGPTDSYKYLNGVLEKVAHDLRPAETRKS